MTKVKITTFLLTAAVLAGCVQQQTKESQPASLLDTQVTATNPLAGTTTPHIVIDNKAYLVTPQGDVVMSREEANLILSRNPAKRRYIQNKWNHAEIVGPDTVDAMADTTYDEVGLKTSGVKIFDVWEDGKKTQKVHFLQTKGSLNQNLLRLKKAAGWEKMPQLEYDQHVSATRWIQADGFLNVAAQILEPHGIKFNVLKK